MLFQINEIQQSREPFLVFIFALKIPKNVCLINIMKVVTSEKIKGLHLTSVAMR
jgi:hypothetical protein